MSAFVSPKEDRRRKWRVLVCVLLIGLLLYNPFLALGRACDGLAYQALARHRATVGASEMQHFVPVKAETIHPDASVRTEMGELPAPEEESHLDSGREHLPLLLERVTNHWFRPPPRA